jgi:hypothetical protein
MQAATAARRQALDAESAASAAHVEAEGALQRLVRTHRPGSPTVDDAVANLANRRSEYDQACEASVRVDTAYHEQQLEEVLQDRRIRWADHDEQIQAARHPTGAVGLQQAQAGDGDAEQHQGQSGEDAVLPPASKNLKTGPQPCEAAAIDQGADATKATEADGEGSGDKSSAANEAEASSNSGEGRSQESSGSSETTDDQMSSADPQPDRDQSAGDVSSDSGGQTTRTSIPSSSELDSGGDRSSQAESPSASEYTPSEQESNA